MVNASWQPKSMASSNATKRYSARIDTTCSHGSHERLAKYVESVSSKRCAVVCSCSLEHPDRVELSRQRFCRPWPHHFGFRCLILLHVSKIEDIVKISERRIRPVCTHNLFRFALN